MVIVVATVMILSSLALSNFNVTNQSRASHQIAYNSKTAGVAAHNEDLNPVTALDISKSLDNISANNTKDLLQYSANKIVENVVWNLQSNISGLDQFNQSLNHSLEAVEGQLNLMFLKWYLNSPLISVVSRLDSNTTSHAFEIFLKNNTKAQTLVRKITDIESSLNSQDLALQVEFNNITSHKLGRIVSIEYLNNGTSNQSEVINYNYSFSVSSEHYTLLYSVKSNQNGTTVLDPLVFENSFPITTHILWWTETIGMQLNTNLVFTNYANAQNFEKFLISNLELQGILNDVLTGLYFGLLSFGIANYLWASIIVFLATTAFTSLLGSTSPLSIANSVETAFNNQEATYGLFKVIYTYNWYYGLASSFSVWATILGGSINFWSSTTLPTTSLTSNMMNNYVQAWSGFDSQYGDNTWVYFAEPPSWIVEEQIWAT